MNVKYPIRQWGYVLFILLVFLSLFLYMINILESGGVSFVRFISQTLWAIPFLVVLVIINFSVVRRIHTNHFLFEHFIPRFFVEFIYVILSAVLLSLIGSGISIFFVLSRAKIDSLPHFTPQFFMATSSIPSVIINFISVSLIEIIHHNELNRQKSVAYERMQKEHAEMLYNQLKGQINPHFLFNSFNILNSLIEADNSRARNFVYQLSDIYRYILTYNSNQLIHLEKEINFIQSYIRILQIRFSNALDVRIDVPTSLYNKFISPMTLQLLVENAVKHNIASVRSPLFVHIYCDAGFIIVENNLNPKPQLQAGTGVGLKNIKNKYHLLGNSNMEIYSDSHMFTVRIPLL